MQMCLSAKNAQEIAKKIAQKIADECAAQNTRATYNRHNNGYENDDGNGD